VKEGAESSAAGAMDS
jgi:hypothetical protein